MTEALEAPTVHDPIVDATSRGEMREGSQGRRRAVSFTRKEIYASARKRGEAAAAVARLAA
jgi:hypothetical protein